MSVHRVWRRSAVARNPRRKTLPNSTSGLCMLKATARRSLSVYRHARSGEDRPYAWLCAARKALPCSPCSVLSSPALRVSVHTLRGRRDGGCQSAWGSANSGEIGAGLLQESTFRSRRPRICIRTCRQAMSHAAVNATIQRYFDGSYNIHRSIHSTVFVCHHQVRIKVAKLSRDTL